MDRRTGRDRYIGYALDAPEMAVPSSSAVTPEGLAAANLPPNQRRAAEFYALAWPVRDIARVCDVSTHTLKKWRQNPDFRVLAGMPPLEGGKKPAPRETNPSDLDHNPALW